MALNLWTTNGKASSFNPLPSTWTYGTSANSLNLPPSINVPNCNAVLSFWAYSPSSGIVHLNSTNVAKDFNLTPTRTFFSYILASPSPFNHIDLTDKNSNGDIIIDSISLVQAPLAKNTINGVDGFFSGKWSSFVIGSTLTPLTDGSYEEILSDSAIKLHFVTSGWKQKTLSIPCKPNTQYVLSGIFSSDNNNGLNLRIDGTNPFVNGIYTSTQFLNGITLTTSSSASSITIYLQSNYVETLTFSNLILNLGSTPVPYEPKRGDKMVLPTAKKNLIVQPSNNYGARWGTTVTKISDSEFKVVTIGANPDEGISFNLPLQYLGKTLTFSVDVMGSGAPLRLSQGESNVGAINPYLNISPTDSYTRFFNTFTNRSSFSSISNVLQVIVSTSVISACTFYVRFPQLEEGTTATPYAPYAVQVNPKPRRLVPKKNLISNPDFANGNTNGWSAWGSGGSFTLYSGSTYSTNGYSLHVTTTASGSGVKFPFTIDNTKTYKQSLSVYVVSGQVKVTHDGTDDTSNWVTPSGQTGWFTITNTMNAGLQTSNNFYIWGASATAEFYVDWVQLEQGSTATAFEPYTLVNPRANSGLSFNGVTDYLQLPSMTIDRIDIDCLLNPKSGVYQTLFDDRANGGTHVGEYNSLGTFYTSGGFISPTVTNGIRNVVSLVSNGGSFSSSPRIMSNYNNTSAISGTLYKVTCYLNGNVVAQYDFTNPRTVTGTTVLGNGNQNLLPSFDSGQWTIHANAKVLGKDVLHLDANTAWDESTYLLPFAIGQTYKLSIGGLTTPSGGYSYYIVRCYDSNNNILTSASITTPFMGSPTFTVPNGTVQVKVFLGNSVASSFDFIRPQLYQLDGTEGTINGNPKVLQPQPKRRLFAKR